MIINGDLSFPTGFSREACCVFCRNRQRCSKIDFRAKVCAPLILLYRKRPNSTNVKSKKLLKQTNLTAHGAAIRVN